MGRRQNAQLISKIGEQSSVLRVSQTAKPRKGTHMTPDFMLVGVVSLIFVAVIIAALTASGEGELSEGHSGSEGGSKDNGPAKSNRHGDKE